MSCQGFAKISETPELLIRIYELLTFLDQLRLSRVNQQFKSIFFNHIHPQKYRVVKIVKTPSGDFFVSNERDGNRLLLTPEGLEEFVQVYAEHVEDLIEDMGLMFHDYAYAYPNRTTNVNIEKFHNLTRLQYVSLLIQEEQMELVAESCPQLRELYLISCSRGNKEDDEEFMIGNGLSIKTLQQMDKLKSLEIDGLTAHVKISYSIFRELVTTVNLESLKLGNVLDPDLDGTDLESDYIHHHLKELQISTSFDCKIWSNKFLSLLRNFEHLSILTLGTPDDVTDAILDLIAKTCKNLEKLTIDAYTTFRDIKQFSMPPKVTEFAISNCYGLTHVNLKQLLTQFGIQKFKSGNVIYQGEFEDFSVSPFLQVLDLADVSTYKFPSSYINNANMKELHWYVVKDGDEDDKDDSDEGLTSCQDPGPLETCINLETLNVSDGFMPLSVILKLKHLRKLEIPQDMSNLSWSYITAILKHPPLNELVVDGFCFCDPAYNLLNATDIPTQGFPTNITSLSIYFEIFIRALDFWLDLLNQNPEMMLMCNSFEIEDENLKKLIDHDSFPKDLRTIDIWGFNIDCNDLRRNFNATMKALKEATDQFAPEYIYFEKISRLILNTKQ